MDRKKKFRLLVTVILLILLAEALVFNRHYFVHKFSGLEQRRLLVEDGVLNQLSYENGALIPRKGNPRILFDNINMRIMAISVACRHSSATTTGQVFYRSDDQPFRAQNSVTYRPHRNGSEIVLAIPRTPFVSDLRISFFDQEGDVIRCKEFVINPYSQFRITLTRLTLYISILSLAMLEFSKRIRPESGYLHANRLSNIKKIKERFPHILSHKGIVTLTITWVLLWLLPWATWLDALPWLRTGLGLLVFITPGLTVSMLIARDWFSLHTHFSVGLAFSVFWLGALGFTSRVFNWPFEYVKILFAASGLVALLALLRYSTSKRPFYKHLRFSGRTLIFLLFMIVFGILANLPSQHSSDDLSYVAYLTNWQHAQQLDFREITFGVGTADSIRFWWSMFPMSLALLAEISHVHGLLLLSIYLEPFMLLVVIFAAYALCEDLLPSQDQAITATLIQFTFLYILRQAYQPGHMFFERPSDDKVFAAFALAPVFFLALRYFLGAFHWRSGLFLLLAGSSLALTHPIILAYSVFIAGVYAAIETILKKEYAKLGILTILLLLILAPSASLRFVDEVWVTRSILGLEPTVVVPDTFSLDAARDETVRTNVNLVISYMDGTPFYGFNLDRIRITPREIPNNPVLVFLSLSYLWILGLGFLWSLFNLNKDIVAPFIVATSLLVLLCVIPYTGWLVGYFVSARMLYRAPWLLPIGLIVFNLAKELLNAFKNKLSANVQFKINDILYIWMPVACLILMMGFSEFIYRHQGLQGEQLDNYRNRLNTLVQLGYSLDNYIDQPGRFVAHPGLMDYLPGLSAKSKVVLFRLEEWAPYPINKIEIGGLILADPDISMERRIEILDKYNVQFILTDDFAVQEYYARHPDLFSAHSFDGYWLIKFRE